MCLLAQCIESNLNIVVVLVNYNLRNTAGLEENIVRDYCDARGIPFYASHPKKEVVGNFQAWAREARYAFYKIIYEIEKCDFLLLGHQLDDHIETYLMSQQRKSNGWYCGIQRDTYHHDMHILRPLLDMRKKDTRLYCEENRIPYHDDESNFTDHYQRNIVRHSLIETATDTQIKEWINEIDKQNRELSGKIQYVDNQYDLKGIIPIEKYASEVEDARAIILRRMMYQYNKDYNPSAEMLKQLDQDIINGKNGYYRIVDNIELVHEYGMLYMNIVDEQFEYHYDKLEYVQTDHFKLSEIGTKIEGVTLEEKDFPITIRNYRIGDTIQMRYGKKRVSRFLIDRKIKRKDRLNWIVIENNEHNIVFVAGLGCDVNHYSIKPNLFVLK